MSRSSAQVDVVATEQLLSALETPHARLSASTFQSLPGRAGAQLLETGLLKPDGYETTIVRAGDAEDRLVTLSWSEEHQHYGYFQPTRGWVSVPHADIVRYCVDVPAWLEALTKKLLFLPKAKLSPLIPDSLWDIGNSRFGNSAGPTSILFGRRLFDRDRWQSIKQVLNTRPSQSRRVLLTSTQRNLLPEPPKGTVLIAVADLFSNGLALDQTMISARLDGLSVVNKDEPLVIIGDGREIRFLGRTYRFVKGAEQRRIICYLYERYLDGELRVSVDLIVADLELRAKTRIRDIFKDNPAWGELLIVRDGMCGFCWPEN